jgi:uncharacterized 2Fe-2S/4Fe-4S cluster protein (DUF4445 family)
MPEYQVDLEPVGRRTSVPTGETLLTAAQQAGVALISVCGGSGTCQECRVRLMSGKLSPLSLIEEATFSADELKQGFRLACQASPLSNVKIEIPPESLTTPQRLQIEGQEEHIELEPLVFPVEVQLSPPSLKDLRADTTRLADEISALGMPPLMLDLPVISHFSERMRDLNWQGRLAVHRSRNLISVLPSHKPLFGMAVDVGTTKVAAYLVNLESGETAGKLGAMNPQIAYGEDVVSRIAYANQGEMQRLTLQERLVATLNEMLLELRTGANVTPEQVVDAVVVGNTAMHHLFAGLSVRQLGQAPYVAAVSDPLDFPASQIGLDLAPGAFVHLPPNIAGYVGADHIAMLIATQAWQAEAVTVALDIGTNTEISLAVGGGRLLSCSCASGPAFEGAHILAGMRAAPGAIERVQRLQGEFRVSTIGNQLPVGICGSGILDVVAEMLAGQVIDHRGILQRDHPGVRAADRGGAFLLVPAEASGTGREILVNRRDVNEIQLAKAAIRAGVEILLLDAGLTDQDIQQFIVAGAFGTYLYLPNAVRIGMFPNIPGERYHQVGNAAGMGARQMLVSKRKRLQAQEILKRVEYVELTTHPAFSDVFVKAISFDPF